MQAQRSISKNRFLSVMSRKINFKLISTDLSTKTNLKTPFSSCKIFSMNYIWQGNSEKTAKNKKTAINIKNRCQFFGT